VKICCTCKIEKDDNFFGKRKANKDGLKGECRACNAEKSRLYREKYPEIHTESHRRSKLKHKEKIAAYNKEWNIKNKEHVREYVKNNREKAHVRNRKNELATQYRRAKGIQPKVKMSDAEYKRKCILRANAYKKKNPEKVAAYKLRWQKEKLQTDTQYRLRTRLRTRIYHALKGTVKSQSTQDLIGCSVDKLTEHIASQFTEGMGWDNYGDWHVDHIKPCAAFDLTNHDEQAECFNYKNLQPLWAFANMSKGSKYKAA